MGKGLSENGAAGMQAADGQREIPSVRQEFFLDALGRPHPSPIVGDALFEFKAFDARAIFVLQSILNWHVRYHGVRLPEADATAFVNAAYQERASHMPLASEMSK